MQGFVLILLAMAVASCGRAYDAVGPSPEKSPLVDLVADRVAGEPTQCVNMHELRGSTLLPGEGAVIFEGPGRTLYLNRFYGRCQNVRTGLALRITHPSGRLCAGETVEFFDPAAEIGHGACTIGDFVPYSPLR